ncbi:MAG TPA: ABC transporter ATP-binding protein [bacterium]
MEPLINLHNASKVYKIGKLYINALKDLNLIIESGEFISIIGPSGSGKSTLMNIIGFLDILTEGSYHFRSKDVSYLEEDELSGMRNREIGFVFQNFNLLSRTTAIKNVELPLLYAGADRKRRQYLAEKAIETVGLKQRQLHNSNELSGGEIQRVAIARAIVANPQIILADEPTGNLDSKTGKEILETFERLHSQGRTVILVTHDPAVAEKANRIISLLDGRINRDVRK